MSTTPGPVAPADPPCGWAPAADPLYRGYHDTEWGVPERDPRALWEKLQLDGHQAGLAWITILRKRETMREEFEGFVPETIASWSEARVQRALTNPGIIRSPAKVRATVRNAQAYCDLVADGTSFSDYLWDWVDDRVSDSRLERWDAAPTRTDLSERLARDLKRRGFTFCGPVIVYAFLQAVGLVDDHELRCPRHDEVLALDPGRS